MLLLPQSRLFLSTNSNCNRVIFMGFKHLLLLKPTLTPVTHTHAYVAHFSSTSQPQLFSTHRKNIAFSTSSPKPISPIYRMTSGLSYYPHAAMPTPRPVSGVVLETPEQQVLDSEQLRMLKQKLEDMGIDGDACMPGQYYGLVCPNCKGGDSEEKSLSLHITEDGAAAVWNCFRAKCGWRGTTRAFADIKSTYAKMNRIGKIKQPLREITEESLELEPLCSELLAYFADRMISGETLRRNFVMQKRSGNQIAIAFTYRRNGELVNCKYRTITKKFWRVCLYVLLVILHS
ncbi:twinkle homolog protein, chloroplastic/mitochondrial-like [Olea europaea var. sylvestris]|uniref:twinkle homolog protein, chloroplastic/mitochondrial-like n=1 Tax=Olea europaea var. sylvestris TaxID=158386 RepID=UPI000C1D6AC3|nr:twinkle homolog protein, chloroplastic/mitochondrial-like [Olea europaea var. sylvestris]